MNYLRSRKFALAPLNLLRMANRNQRKQRRREAFKIPKKGSAERIAIQKEKINIKREIEEKEKDQRGTPKFLTAILLGSSLPQTAALYSMIWNPVLSDTTFYMFDITYGWIALLLTMEGAAITGLGYADYLTKKSPENTKIFMRK